MLRISVFRQHRKSIFLTVAKAVLEHLEPGGWNFYKALPNQPKHIRVSTFCSADLTYGNERCTMGGDFAKL